MSLGFAVACSESGKALLGDDLKSGELLVIVFSMILTVDRKHHFLLCTKVCFVARIIDTGIFVYGKNITAGLAKNQRM